MNGFQIAVIACWVVGFVCNLTRLSQRISGDTPAARALAIFLVVGLQSITPICLIEGGFFK